MNPEDQLADTLPPPLLDHERSPTTFFDDVDLEDSEATAAFDASPKTAGAT